MPKVRRHGIINHVVDPKVVENAQLDNYNRGYGFKKAPTNRSPLRGWEADHMRDHVCDAYCSHSKKETDMVNAKPHGYRHEHVGGRAGKLRLSNTKGAHRLGARKRG